MSREIESLIAADYPIGDVRREQRTLLSS